MTGRAIDVGCLVDSLRGEAKALAGNIGALTQRASVYHHMFQHSGRNHTFPLLAAHGALWAKGYFQAGIRFGSAAAWGQAIFGNDRQELVQRLHKFANDFVSASRLTSSIFSPQIDASRAWPEISYLPTCWNR